VTGAWVGPRPSAGGCQLSPGTHAAQYSSSGNQNPVVSTSLNTQTYTKLLLIIEITKLLSV
jgi:hypothetical protein